MFDEQFQLYIFRRIEMRKKYLIFSCTLLLAAFIGCGQIVAQDNITLGLSQMVTLAISNNLRFKKVSYQLENTKLETKKIEAENLLNKSSISNLQKEITLLSQQSQFQSEKDQLLIQVVDDYFRLLMAEKEIESNKKNEELEKIILEDTEKQVAAGYSINLDLLQQGNEYYDALFSYQGSKLNYQQIIIEIKDRLGIDHDQSIELLEMEIPEFPEISLADAINKARENSVTLRSQEINLEKANRELEIAKANNLPEIEILKLENNLGIAQLDKSLAEQELDYQVESQWLNYNQANNDIILSKRSLDQMKENEEMIQQQVQAGLRSDEEALSATIGVLDAQSRLISSIRQAYQAYLELQRLMGSLDEGDLK
jgi:outer membrane protein TolC